MVTERSSGCLCGGSLYPDGIFARKTYGPGCDGLPYSMTICMPWGTDLLGTHLMFSGSAVTKLPFINTVMPSLSLSPCAKGNASGPNNSPVKIASLLTEIPIHFSSRSLFNSLVSPPKWYHLKCDGVASRLATALAGTSGRPGSNKVKVGEVLRLHTACADSGFRSWQLGSCCH